MTTGNEKSGLESLQVHARALTGMTCAHVVCMIMFWRAVIRRCLSER